MKKLVLVPQTDTITICLPPAWVGQTIICILKVNDVIICERDILTSGKNKSRKEKTG